VGSLDDSAITELTFWSSPASTLTLRLPVSDPQRP
jgi:hypothetical protein